MATNKPATLTSTIKEKHIKFHELLGRGASGDVYRVTWKSKHRGKIEAAAKKIPIIKGKTSEEQLGNELYYLQNLKHPNIIEYYGQVVTSTHVIIVTEYAAKGSLYDYLKKVTHLPPELKVQWATEAVSGIQYLRENNILHRDIKSPNFLITADNTLKICDFGIAKDLTSTRTATSTTGTIRWLAPEVFTDFKLSPKADIFAFGITLWEMETCEEPYKGQIEEQVMWNVGTHDLRPEIPQKCSAAIRDLIERCWDKDWKKRPEVAEIIQKLESSLQWHYKHEINTHVNACHWVDHQHLAVCTQGCVKVYEVTTEGSRLEYTLTSNEWKGEAIEGVAVSESMPNSILVICKYKPYVYQYPCHEAKQQVKKYKIHGDKVNPGRIAANDNTAVIALCSRNTLFSEATFFRGNTLVVCSLPDFTHQSHVQTSVPFDLSITNDYLLVMGRSEMLVKPLSDMSRYLYWIQPPNGWTFDSVSFRNNARQIYAACTQGDDKGFVYKYTWDGIGKPQYVNNGCVIDGLERVGDRCLSVTSDGLLVVGEWGHHSKVKVFSLE